MAEAVNAGKVCKVLSIVSVLYLGGGLVNIFGGIPMPRIMAVLYVVCVVVGMLAVAASFMRIPETFRALVLWSVGPAVPILGTESWQVAFPGLLNIPISFYVSFGGGRIFAGVNLVSGLLFVFLAIFGNRLVKASAPGKQQQELPPDEE
jgi:hypothetical protein